MNDEEKTFEDLGLSFDFDEDCVTCSDGTCHSNVVSKVDGKEYNVYISANKDFDSIYISATPVDESSNGDSDESNFDTESEAVKHLCSTYEGFKCF